MPIPAPSRGMNTLSDHLSLPADQARYLENFLPVSGYCAFRPGYSEYSTISGASSTQSLMEHLGASGTTLVAAASDGGIYNASAVPATSLATGYGTDPWSFENANGYLIAVNGEDTPWRYDGSSVTATGLSGVTLTTLRTVKRVRERLWFTVVGSADVWYTEPGAIAGALTQFQLSQIASGGHCMGVYPWRDNTVFVMSTGEILVYAGDPGTDFAKYGSYRAPRPIAYDAAVKIGGDLVIMTVSAPITMELVAAGLAFDMDSLQGWGKIAPSWASDCATYESNPGWNAVYHDGIAYFNVPTASDDAKQYVCNLNVPGGAWTVYTNLKAAQFARTESGLFYGDKSDGRICQHTGAQDDGEMIVAIGRQGMTYPTQGRSAMQYTMARLNYSATGHSYATMHVDTDFLDDDFSAAEVALSLISGSGAWGEPWGSPWGTEAKAQLRWQSVSGYGTAVAPAVRIRTNSTSFKWYATDVLAIPGSGK